MRYSVRNKLYRTIPLNDIDNDLNIKLERFLKCYMNVSATLWCEYQPFVFWFDWTMESNQGPLILRWTLKPLHLRAGTLTLPGLDNITQLTKSSLLFTQGYISVF